jgi:hypothetical protein
MTPDGAAEQAANDESRDNHPHHQSGIGSRLQEPKLTKDNQPCFLVVVRLEKSQNPVRISYYNGVGRNVFRHQRFTAHNRTAADLDSTGHH